jgi:hypothetical protein
MSHAHSVQDLSVKQLSVRHATTVVGMATIFGCSGLFGPSGPPINVSFAVESVVGSAFAVRNEIGGRRVVLTADPVRGGHASTDVQGPRFGDVPVQVTLLTTGGDSVTAVSFSQNFQHGSHHWVAARVGRHRVLSVCASSVLAAPLSAASTHTLYVTYGGIPDNAVC